MIQTIILLGCFLVLFSALLFLSIRHGNRKANKFLAFFCIGVAGFLLRGYLLISGHYVRIPLLTELIDNIRYLMCPALYFFVLAAADPDFRFRKYDLLHLLPLTFNLVVKTEYYLSGSDLQIRFLSQWMNGLMLQSPFFWDNASRIVFFMYFIFFLFLSVHRYLRDKKMIEQSSPFGRIYSSWIALFILTLSPVFLLWILCVACIALGRPFLPYLYSMYLFASFMVFLCIYTLFLRPEIIYRAKPMKGDKKYQTSYLTDQEANAHFDRLQSYMEKEAGFTNPDLTLQSLAEKLSIPKNYLSQIINEKAGKTFHDFINTYRIEKIKKLLEDPRWKDETLLALALEGGFNSKTTFNTAFKKHTGESPIAWRKKHLK